jgi:hypothetical protein
MKQDNKTSNEKLKEFYQFLEVIGTGGSSGIFSGIPFGPFGEPEEKYPYDRLGDGYELRPIEIKDKKGNLLENRNEYSHLYHNELKVSNLIFRRGGLGGTFINGYCQLIHYTQKKEHTEKQHGFDYGVHVIINKLGDICLSGSGISSYPSHYGGNVGKLKDTFFNLCTGEEILTCSSSSSINGQNFIIVEHRYDWYNKELPLGVYRIDKFTCEIKKIDNVKK